MSQDKDKKPPHPAPEEPEPTDLHEPINWMTYTHEELYKMVTTGVDLGGAGAVKDTWTKVGTTLQDVQDRLRNAILRSMEGWTGESAEKARTGLLEVADWAADTSDHAKNVAGCINTEIENVDRVQKAMPPPPAPAPVLPPAPPPTLNMTDRVGDMFGVQTDHARFVGMATVGDPALTAVATNDAAHRQAADLMAAFQQSSIAVDKTVPQFVPPTNPVAPPVVTTVPPATSTPPPVADGGGGPVPVNSGRTGTSQQRGGGFGRPAASGGFSGRTFMPGTPAAAGGGAAASTPGGGSGVVSSESGARSGPGAAAAASQAARPGAMPAGMIGGAPMAGAPARSNDDEREHSRASYLEEDDNLFGLDRKAAPPVIGQ